MQQKPIFRPSFGNRPDQLVGRDDVMGWMLGGLQEYPGSAGRSMFLMGQRGMGKTAILLEVADRAKELGYVTARVTCGDAMLDTLIEALQRAGSEFVKEQRKPIKGFSAGAMGFSFGLTFTDETQRSFGFRAKLEMICERLAEADKRVLLLVDEVHPSVEQMRTLAATYQELVGDEADIAIVMAGLPSAVSEMLNYKTLTFLNRAERTSLEAVPVAEVEAYYHSAFMRAGLETDEAIERLAAESSEGFPFLMQLIGFYLVKYARQSAPVDAATFERAANAARSELDEKVFRAVLAPLSERDVAFLEAMAQDEGTTRVSDVEERLAVAHGTAQTYRRRLLDAGVIAAPQRGRIAFAIPQLAEYLRRK